MNSDWGDVTPSWDSDLVVARIDWQRANALVMDAERASRDACLIDLSATPTSNDVATKLAGLRDYERTLLSQTDGLCRCRLQGLQVERTG